MCTGVGNIQLSARQEWIVKFRKKDGNVQLVRGLSLDAVCAPMPTINTVQAVDELKKILVIPYFKIAVFQQS